MEIENRASVKSRLLEQVNDYLLSLHDVNEVSKGNYGACFKSFVQYLENRGIKRFEEVSKTILGQFLSTKGSQNTRNLYIFVIKNFYKNYLDKSDLVEKPVCFLRVCWGSGTQN